MSIPIIEGRTTIYINPFMIEKVSISTFCPTRNESVCGTRNGESIVSNKIIDKAKAIFPLYIVTQIKLVIPVGITEANTNQTMRSLASRCAIVLE
jgi:hypothetical protein